MVWLNRQMNLVRVLDFWLKQLELKKAASLVFCCCYCFCFKLIEANGLRKRRLCRRKTLHWFLASSLTQKETGWKAKVHAAVRHDRREPTLSKIKKKRLMPLILWVAKQEAEKFNDKMARYLVRGAGQAGLGRAWQV